LPRVSLRDWPRLTRFYGIGPDVLARMPHVLLRLYAEQLPALVAEEALLGFTTADMPHMDKADRGRVARIFEKHLPAEEAPKLDVREAEGAKAITTLGIGVHIEPSEVESSEETHA
jgi:hypothetical protein